MIWVGGEGGWVEVFESRMAGGGRGGGENLEKLVVRN
jgi:hypothetical protein